MESAWRTWAARALAMLRVATGKEPVVMHVYLDTLAPTARSNAPGAHAIRATATDNAIRVPLEMVPVRATRTTRMGTGVAVIAHSV